MTELLYVPASYAQQRMWFLDQLEPGNPAYTIASAVRLHGKLELDALRSAVQATIDRHEALRTTFQDVDGDGTCVQVIHPPMTASFQAVDLSALPDPMARAVGIIEQAREQPFDLARGPLIDVYLSTIGPDAHVLAIRMHHIISDGWSLDVVARDLSAFYSAAVEATSLGLPELEIQYADYAVWQREWMQGDTLDEQLTYWRNVLTGAPALLELPLDRARPANPGHPGAFVVRRWPSALVGDLREMARQSGSTLFMVLLAGYAALLQRYGSGEDVVIGTPVAGRGRPELDDVVGLFVNTLALRLAVDTHCTFGDLLLSAREVVLAALAHQELPFERLVEALRPERSLSYAPVVQTLLVLENAAAGESSGTWPGLTLAALERDSASVVAKFDLSVFGYEVGDALDVVVEYDTDLFDARTVERMLDHLHELLAAAVESSDIPLADVAVPEIDPGPAARAGHDAATLVGLFIEQVARTPRAVAVERDGAGLDFAELDRRSDEVATRVRGCLVSATALEPLVALCLPRSLDLVVAMVGVLKAGAAYVPLDPAYPGERLESMLEDSQADLVVTVDALADALPSVQVPRLLLDADSIADQSGSPALAGPVTTADKLAYVLYTSGTTGRPKGVQITHANAVAMLRWAARQYEPAERARVLATTSVCFDLSVFEIFLPLCFGGTVVLADNILAAVEDGVAATLVNTVPSALAEVLRLGPLPPTTQTICLAGEALPGRLALDAYARPGVGRVDNLYGPTEDTTYSTWVTVPRDSVRSPSIGIPIDGTAAYVLDLSLHPVAEGGPGELYLCGLGVARGYLRQAALTAERFVPDPFSVGPGGRMYRTGDLVRMRGDDELAYLGRLDHQVKLRGFRIELGEIEFFLRDHPSVRDAVVLADHASAHGARLVAFVTGNGRVASSGELAAHCARRVPAFMVPSRYVVLDDLPRTPNGKTDRKALVIPSGAEPGRIVEYVPSDALERQVAAMWSDLLGLGQFGARENFFALGGHSLLATQLVARLRIEFGIALPLRAVFESPTVSGLSDALVAAQQPGSDVRAYAELREHIDSLSGDEVMALLDDE